MSEAYTASQYATDSPSAFTIAAFVVAAFSSVPSGTGGASPLERAQTMVAPAPEFSPGLRLVNIAEYRRRTRSSTSSLALVFARSTITASRAQRMKLVFAYSDQVHVFVNGRLLFAGDSTFQSRDPSFLGIAFLGPDAIYVDLRPGPNEIVLAVSEKFGGWGFAARLEPLGAESGQ